MKLLKKELEKLASMAVSPFEQLMVKILWEQWGYNRTLQLEIDVLSGRKRKTAGPIKRD